MIFFFLFLKKNVSDIHAAVREIATINNVDLGKIRNMLLEKWICKTGPAVTKVGSLFFFLHDNQQLVLIQIKLIFSVSFTVLLIFLPQLKEVGNQNCVTNIEEDPDLVR